MQASPIGQSTVRRKKQTMKTTALLILALLLGCSKQENAKDDLSGSDTRSTALMSDKEQLPEIYAILRDFPWESLNPDTTFSTVIKQKAGSYYFASNSAQWVAKGSDAIAMTNELGETAHIQIVPNVNGRSFVEGYMGCELYFPGLVSFEHFYSITTPSSFRLVLLLQNSATREHIVEVDTIFCSNGPNAETNSVLVQSEFCFPQHISVIAFRNQLLQYGERHKGVCKQVEALYQKANAVIQAKAP